MALPTFQTQAFGLDTSAASVTVPITAFTPSEGDAILVLTASDTNPDGHIVTGNNTGSYTFLFETTSSGPSSVVALGVQGATPDTSVTVDLIQIRAQGTTGLLVLVPGYDSIDATLVSASNATGMPNPPSLTTNTAGAVRIITGHLDDDQVDPVTAPSGFEQIAHHAIAGSSGGNSTIMVAFREEATAGALDPDAFGGSGDDEGWATHFSVILDTGGGTTAEVVPVGLSASGTIGTPSVTAQANVTPTGLLSAGTIGSATVTAEANVTPTGLAATGSIGSPAVTTDAQVAPLGLVSTGLIGSPEITAQANVSPLGLLSSGTIGTPSVVSEATVTPAGLLSSGTVGSPTVSTTPSASVTPVGLISAGTIGSPSVEFIPLLEPVGMSASGVIGSTTVTSLANLSLIGLYVPGEIGSPIVTAPTDGGAPPARTVYLGAQSRIVAVAAQTRIVSA